MWGRAGNRTINYRDYSAAIEKNNLQAISPAANLSIMEIPITNKKGKRGRSIDKSEYSDLI